MGKLKDLLIYGPQDEPREERQLEQVTDIGVAFTAAQQAILGAQQDSAIATVYRGVQFLTDTVASLEMDAVDSRTELPIGEDRPAILELPNPNETYHDTIAAVMASLVWRGNAYLVPMTRTQTGEITSLIVAHPDEVQVGWDKKRLFREYAWRDKDMEHGKDIVHISMNRWPGQALGVGPITAARIVMDIAKAENEFVRALWDDNATPSLAIEVAQKLSKQEAEDVQAMFEEAHRKRHRPAVVSGGATLKPLTINPTDAEFLESRKFTVQEIARMLGIWGYFLNVEQGSSLTYSTTETLFQLQLTATINPTYLERIEQGWSILLPRGRKAKFDISELMRTDSRTRYETYEIGIEAGFLTVDEVRAKEGLPPFGEPPNDEE